MNSTTTISETGHREKINLLLDQAKAADSGDRRNEQRHPFFRPVTISTIGTGGHSFPAFSRDISDSGMGLLSHAQLLPTKVSLTISTESGDKLDLAGEIMWCESCGEGWYLSGIKFPHDQS